MALYIVTRTATAVSTVLIEADDPAKVDLLAVATASYQIDESTVVTTVHEAAKGAEVVKEPPP